MLAYKGFKEDLTCTFGRGTFQYEAGSHHNKKVRFKGQ